MDDFISKVKEKAADIDVKQIVEDVKTKIEYLDMGTVLGDAVRAAEKIDVSAIKEKVNDIRDNPVVGKVEEAAKAAVAIPVGFVSGFLGKDKKD